MQLRRQGLRWLCDDRVLGDCDCDCDWLFLPSNMRNTFNAGVPADTPCRSYWLPYWQITFAVWKHLHAHVCAVSSLTFLDTSSHSKRFQLIKFFLSSHNVFGSVKQLSIRYSSQSFWRLSSSIVSATESSFSLSQLLRSRLFVYLDVRRSSSDLRCIPQHCLASVVFLLYVS